MSATPRGAVHLGLAAAAGGVAVAATVAVVAALQRRRRRGGVGVPLKHVSEGKAYLDWNATSPIFPEVTEAVLPYVCSEFGNPSSDHCFGVPSREAVARARASVARMLGCDSSEVIFCGCGSEADNHALRGAVRLLRSDLPAGAKPHVISSAIEHVAISACLDDMAQAGEVEVTYIGVDRDGVVEPSAVAAAVKRNTVLISVMHSNNEVGTIQDIRAIADASRAAHKNLGGDVLLVHTDAAQSVGKVAVRPRDLGADLATIVGHKFGAPKGVAALYVRQGVKLPAFILGGGQEGGRRAGTEAVPQIVALGAAAEVVARELPEIAAHMRRCRDLLYEVIAAGVGRERVCVNGPPLSAGDARRLPNTLSIGIRGASAGAILAALSRQNIAASASAACHAADVAHAQVSFVLRAMDVPHDVAVGTLRLSVGRHTTPEELARAARAIIESCATPA